MSVAYSPTHFIITSLFAISKYVPIVDDKICYLIYKYEIQNEYQEYKIFLVFEITFLPANIYKNAA